MAFQLPLSHHEAGQEAVLGVGTPPPSPDGPGELASELRELWGYTAHPPAQPQHLLVLCLPVLRMGTLSALPLLPGTSGDWVVMAPRPSQDAQSGVSTRPHLWRSAKR